MKWAVVFLAGFLLIPQAHAVITHVGSAQGNGATTASVTRAAGSTSNLYTIFCGNNNAGSAVTAANTTTAFTWTKFEGPIKNGASQTNGFWAVPSTVASQTITCTATLGSFTNILLDEWSGTDTTTPIDVSSSTFGTTTACSTVGTMSVDNDAMVVGIQDSVTVVGNLNAVVAIQGANDGFQDWTEYRILSGSGSGSVITGTYTGTAAGSECITAGIKPLAAAGGIVCPAIQNAGLICN